jgi:hypothetical protein
LYEVKRAMAGMAVIKWVIGMIEDGKYSML